MEGTHKDNSIGVFFVLIGIGMKRQKTKAQSRVMPVTVKSTVSSMTKKIKTLVRYLCTDQQLEMPFKSYFIAMIFFSIFQRIYFEFYFFT